ncbi:hypothetical protein RHGRI_017576 [Rhododendron griersonianum]|uniref:Cathepsin propeptide inhibitor domain-containing protein n=1 Tax=Rhododendron griersonianum TaxID=479676 RepID=A0AAV6JYJ9_9ERIC|nr:hypothetical protein RHGRI_017576 [Rhododendron griersonianum]
MSRSLQDASISEKHKQWMAWYGRVYKDFEEEGQRLKIFKDNVEYIESSNRDAKKRYKLAVNQFADLTNEEYVQATQQIQEPYFLTCEIFL